MPVPDTLLPRLLQAAGRERARRRWSGPSDCGSLVRPAVRSPAPAYADLRSRRDETGPVSQGRWLVSLTQWTEANPRPCHWISLMQAEPRYSR
jgi:hypothetical protein